MLVEYFRVGERLLAFLVTPRAPGGRAGGAACPRVQHILRLLQFQLAWARPASRRRARGVARRLAGRDPGAPGRALPASWWRPLRSRLDAAHLIFVPARPPALRPVPRPARRRAPPDRLVRDLVRAERDHLSRLCQRRAPTTGRLAGPRRSGRAGAVHPRRGAVGGRAAAGARSSTWAPRPRSSVLREKGAGRRFVHIAAHGFFRRDNPMFSGIRLGDAPTSRSTTSTT